MLAETELTPESLSSLRESLAALANHAEIEQQHLQFNLLDICSVEDSESASASASAPFSSSATTEDSSGYSTPVQPMEFVRTLFPQLPHHIISRTLQANQADGGEIEIGRAHV